ncbi:MAG: O-antigen ligase family protein [Betaproteobacteria bacterium]|nr:MAG: O-antigen ligase family protein [Betaproteobacteria bacterium]
MTVSSAIFRRDFLSHPNQRIVDCASWLVVALAAAVPLGSATMNIVMGMLVIALLLGGGYRAHWQRVRSNPFAMAAVLLCALITLGTIWSDGAAGEALRVAEKHARLLVGVIAVMLLVDERWRRRALLAWMSAMLLTLALSYLHSVWAFPLARATREAIDGDHYIFKHHITQNVMMSVFAIAALCEAILQWQRRVTSDTLALRWAIFWFVVAGLAVINVLFFVAGRTGYITLACNVFVACLVLARGRQRIALLLGVLLAIAIVATSSVSLRERFEGAVNEVESHQATGAKTSAGQRMEFGRKSLELIAARPILGWGTGSYSQQYCRIARSPEWCALGSYNPHNQFLYFGVQLGIVGILAYLVWFASVAYALRPVTRVQRALGYSVLATLFVHSLLDSPLYIVTEGAFYPLLLGILLAGYGEAREARVASNTASTLGHSG